MTLNFSDSKEQIHFPLFQGTQQEPPSLLRAPSISSVQELNGESCGQELFLGTVGPESNRALSLLSSLQQPHPDEASPVKCINLFNPSQALHHHHHPNNEYDYDYDYDRGVGMDHQANARMLVSQGGMFFQIRHDAGSASSGPPFHLDHRTPSSWED